MSWMSIGNKKIWEKFKLALFCSRKCPPDLIVKALDVAVKLKKQDIAVISSFQTIIEREIFDILLRGKNNFIVYYPARNIKNYHYPGSLKPAVENGRLLIVSNLPEQVTRISEKWCYQRNLSIIHMADAILFIHAHNGSKSESLAQHISKIDKPLYTIESKYNQNLYSLNFTSIYYSDINFNTWLKKK